jgi:hypothetical protein
LKLGLPADLVAQDLSIGSRTISPVFCRPAGRLDLSLQALTCELSSDSNPEEECRSTPSPEPYGTGFCRQGGTSRSAFGPQSLKGLSPIDVACSTQLSKSFVSRRGRGPHFGEDWKARAGGFSCLPRRSFKHLLCRLITLQSN